MITEHWWTPKSTQLRTHVHFWGINNSSYITGENTVPQVYKSKCNITVDGSCCQFTLSHAESGRHLGLSKTTLLPFSPPSTSQKSAKSWRGKGSGASGAAQGHPREHPAKPDIPRRRQAGRPAQRQVADAPSAPSRLSAFQGSQREAHVNRAGAAPAPCDSACR